MKMRPQGESFSEDEYMLERHRDTKVSSANRRLPIFKRYLGGA